MATAVLRRFRSLVGLSNWQKKIKNLKIIPYLRKPPPEADIALLYSSRTACLQCLVPRWSTAEARLGKILPHFLHSNFFIRRAGDEVGEEEMLSLSAKSSFSTSIMTSCLEMLTVRYLGNRGDFDFDDLNNYTVFIFQE